MRGKGVIILVSIGCAILITALLGLVNVTPKGLVGATWYGWPFPWRYIVIYPGSPERYDLGNLLFNVMIWFILILVPGMLFSKMRHAR